MSWKGSNRKAKLAAQRLNRPSRPFLPPQARLVARRSSRSAPPATPSRPAARTASAPIFTEIGRAHVCTPVTNAHLVCRPLLEKKKQQQTANNKPLPTENT